ncbi:MAG: hypothetical protein NVSMB29_18880 [Candidatus Dormibacteria bacterium]
MYDEPPPPPPRSQASPRPPEPQGAPPPYGRDPVPAVRPGSTEARYAAVGTATTSVVGSEPVGPAPVLMLVIGLLAGLLIGLAIAYAVFHTTTG